MPECLASSFRLIRCPRYVLESGSPYLENENIGGMRVTPRAFTATGAGSVVLEATQLEVQQFEIPTPFRCATVPRVRLLYECVYVSRASPRMISSTTRFRIEALKRC